VVGPSQLISGVSADNSLVAFYDTHGDRIRTPLVLILTYNNSVTDYRSYRVSLKHTVAVDTNKDKDNFIC
jgi:hypothetical protein